MGMYSALIMENNISEENSDIFDILDEGLEINTFMEQEYLNLCKEQGLKELAYFEQNRKEIPVNESDESLGKKIKDFVMKWWNKFKQWIESIVNRLKGSNTEFLKKYKEKIQNGDDSGIEFEGYNFTTGASDKNIDRSIASAFIRIDISKGNDSVSSSFDNLKERIENVCLNRDEHAGSLNFSKELFKYFRNDTDKKSKIQVNKGQVLKGLEEYDGNLNNINRAKEKIKGIVDSLSEVAKKENLTFIQKYVSMMFSTINTYINCNIKAIVEENNQNKKMAMKIIANTK